MVLIGYSHLVSYGNLFFTRTGFPLNLTIGQKKCRWQMCMPIFVNANGWVIIYQIL